MKKTERFLILLAFTGIIARLLLTHGSTTVVMMSLFTLSCLYFYFGFAFFNDIALKDIFKRESYSGIAAMRIVGAVLSGIALAIACIGLLFKFNSWPGADLDLGIALVLCSIVSVICFTKIRGKYSAYYSKLMRRLTIASVLCAFLLIIPRKTFLEIMQRDNPEYVKAVEQLWADPDNKELRAHVTEVQKTMNHH